MAHRLIDGRRATFARSLSAFSARASAQVCPPTVAAKSQRSRVRYTAIDRLHRRIFVLKSRVDFVPFHSRPISLSFLPFSPIGAFTSRRFVPSQLTDFLIYSYMQTMDIDVKYILLCISCKIFYVVDISSALVVVNCCSFVIRI